MYKEHFGLLDEPFRMTPDTRYIFKSHRYEESLAALQYGIREKKGFIVITGEIGTGKTTLCRSLLNQLDPTIKTAVILNPSLNRSELLHAILDDLSIDMPAGVPTQKQLLDTLNAFLIEQARAGGNVAVIIDESQNLDLEVLESIRMLSNLETEQEKLLQLILVGQPELNELLKAPKLEQLRQRIAVRYHITPLERDEIPRYISHRLLVAGNEKCVEFTREAIDAIADYTRGTPRLINIICDKCLLAAFALGTRSIDGNVANTAIIDHEGPVYEAPRAHSQLFPRAHSGYGGREERSTRGSERESGDTARAWFPDSQRRNAGPSRRPGPLIAAAILILTVLVIGLGARQNTTSTTTSATSALSASSIASVVSGTGSASLNDAVATASAAPSQQSGLSQRSGPSQRLGPLAELLRIWGADPSAIAPEAAGLTPIRIVADLPTISRIDLPALITIGSDEKTLVEASPTTFTFIDPRASTANHRVSVPRFSFDGTSIVDARIFLPVNWAYPGNVWTDPRLPALLDAGLRSLTPEGFPVSANNTAGRFSGEQTRQAILRFQAASGLPVDGVIGPITWCALVARANPQYPRLAP